MTRHDGDIGCLNAHVAPLEVRRSKVWNVKGNDASTVKRLMKPFRSAAPSAV